MLYGLVVCQMMQCLLLQMGRKPEESKKFYQSLQKCVDEVPKCDVLLVMGDFNTRVGCHAKFGPGPKVVWSEHFWYAIIDPTWK